MHLDSLCSLRNTTVQALERMVHDETACFDDRSTGLYFKLLRHSIQLLATLRQSLLQSRAGILETVDGYARF